MCAIDPSSCPSDSARTTHSPLPQRSKCSKCPHPSLQVPCSTPRMSKPPKGQQTVGINGDLVLDILCLYDVGACGAGSCNTVSRFWNGGTESSSSSSGSSGPSPGGGIPPNSYVAAILSTEFLAEYFTATGTPPMLPLGIPNAASSTAY